MRTSIKHTIFIESCVSQLHVERVKAGTFIYCAPLRLQAPACFRIGWSQRNTERMNWDELGLLGDWNLGFWNDWIVDAD